MLDYVTRDSADKGKLLTVIVPVSRMSGKLQNLTSWVIGAPEEKVAIIIVHDKRDQSTGDELREMIYKSGQSNILLLEGAFGSPGKARNEGIPYVKTEWVCFWDSDDCPKICETIKVLENISKDPDYIICNFSTNNRGVIKQFDHKQNICRVALNPGLWRIIFRFTKIKTVRFPELSMGEDLVYLSSICITSGKIFFSEESTYTYFMGLENQLTNLKNLSSLEAVSEMRKLSIESTRDKFFTIIYVKLFISSLRKIHTQDITFDLLKNFTFLRRINFLSLTYAIFGMVFKWKSF